MVRDVVEYRDCLGEHVDGTFLHLFIVHNEMYDLVRASGDYVHGRAVRLRKYVRGNNQEGRSLIIDLEGLDSSDSSCPAGIIEALSNTRWKKVIICGLHGETLHYMRFARQAGDLWEDLPEVKFARDVTRARGLLI